MTHEIKKEGSEYRVYDGKSHVKTFDDEKLAKNWVSRNTEKKTVKKEPKKPTKKVSEK